MMKDLKMSNVGPAPKIELEFGRRLNLLTGDNGLGKSFLLDIAWWAMTGKWPAELNPKLTAGKVALPTDKKQKAEIDFSFSAVSRIMEYKSSFDPQVQNWTIRQGRPPNPSLLFYALADGSFAVWDPARNYWRSKGKEGKERPAAYVFSPKEVWDGLQREDGTWLCNGLIRDWAGWQKEKGRAFDSLSAVLDVLSPSADEKFISGNLTRISLDDVRDMPTLKMSYGQEVAMVYVSSGMRRIISFAYFLVWCWEEHLKAKELLGEEPETKTVFLVDEVESHLHPRWQRTVIPALMIVMDELMASSGGTVDHFIAKSQRADLAYEWDNYRLACSRMNSHKRDFGDVLAPFEVETGCFHLELVSGCIFPDPHLPEEQQQDIQVMIDRLGLDDATNREMRARHYRKYRQGFYTADFLKKRSRFAWAEANRQGLL